MPPILAALRRARSNALQSLGDPGEWELKLSNCSPESGLVYSLEWGAIESPRKGAFLLGKLSSLRNQAQIEWSVCHRIGGTLVAVTVPDFGCRVWR